MHLLIFGWNISLILRLPSDTQYSSIIRAEYILSDLERITFQLFFCSGTGITKGRKKKLAHAYYDGSLRWIKKLYEIYIIWIYDGKINETNSLSWEIFYSTIVSLLFTWNFAIIWNGDKKTTQTCSKEPIWALPFGNQSVCVSSFCSSPFLKN